MQLTTSPNRVHTDHAESMQSPCRPCRVHAGHAEFMQAMQSLCRSQRVHTGHTEFTQNLYRSHRVHAGHAEATQAMYYGIRQKFCRWGTKNFCITLEIKLPWRNSSSSISQQKINNLFIFSIDDLELTISMPWYSPTPFILM